MATTAQEQKEFDDASRVAQVFSGAMFSALCIYLIMSNSTRVSYIQKASLEKRLSVCCQINTIVAALSAFLNWFQLTEVDNFALSGDRSMVVDVARPVEWILTCPLMQLNLVLMGGSRIPEYRRILMPALSVTVLSLGAFTLFIDMPFVALVWFVACCVHGSQMFVNFRQIKEHSNGAESVLAGDSEFRKATIILMMTWLPFPAWYLLTPEGFGVITSITVVQLGWAFLNVTAKFSLIFFMQRCKDNYCNRLKVKREMKGEMASAYAAAGSFEDEEENSAAAAARKANGQLSACVVETMSDLGMAYNVDRFLTLLREAGISSLDDAEKLDEEACAQAQLPWDLMSALQKRRNGALMEDEAEKNLERGERYYKVAHVTNATNAFNDPKSPKKSKLQSDGTDMSMMPSNVQPLQGIAMPIKNGTQSNEINMGFTNIAAGEMYPAAGPLSDVAAQQIPTSNYGSFHPDMINTPVKSVEKKLEQLENKMLDKFELAVINIGKQFQHQLEKQQGEDREWFGSGLKNMHNMMENSQRMLEAKVEFVLSSQQKEHSQTTEANMDRKFDQLGEKLLLQASMSQEKGSAHIAQAVEQSLDAVNKKNDDFQESFKGALSRMGGSITQMMDGWAQHTIQESKATAFTLQTKMAQLEEAQNKRLAEIEQNFASKLQMVVGAGMDGICSNMTMQTKASFDQIHASIESTKTINEDSNTKMQAKLIHFIKDLNQDFSKNVEMGLGVVGNSLRAQLEGLQASQLSHHNQTQATISTKVDSKLNSMNQQMMEDFKRMKTEVAAHAQELAAHAQSHSQKQMDKYTDQLTTMLKSSKGDKQLVEEMHSTIRDVRAGTDETVDRLAGLYEHLGVTADARRGTSTRGALNRMGSYEQSPQSPARNRPQSAMTSQDPRARGIAENYASNAATERSNGSYEQSSARQVSGERHSHPRR